MLMILLSTVFLVLFLQTFFLGGTVLPGIAGMLLCAAGIVSLILLKKQGKHRLGVLASSVGLILSVLCWQGWLQAQEFVGVTLMGLPVDKFYIYLAIPVGAALMMLQYLLNLFCAFHDKKKGEIDE